MGSPSAAAAGHGRSAPAISAIASVRARRAGAGRSTRPSSPLEEPLATGRRSGLAGPVVPSLPRRTYPRGCVGHPRCFIVGSSQAIGGLQTVKGEGKLPQQRNSAADLLGDWRAAERDSVAARSAASVAELALAAAQAAEEAANETEEAAKLAIEAASRARVAVDFARRAAAHAAEAAQFSLSGAEGDAVRADEEVKRAERAETEARDAFHDAEEKQFPR